MKKWYQSKILWVGVMQLVYGSAMMIAEFIEAASFAPTSIAAFVCGLLLIVFRIWFTDYSIEI